MAKYVLNIIGGIGNQLFQYALGYSLAQAHNAELLLDLTPFENYKLRNFELDNFNVKYQVASNEIIKRLHKKIFFKNSVVGEKTLNFDEKILQIKKDAYLRGYWQSEKYFENYKSDLKKLFTFKNLNFIKNFHLLDQIKNTNSVSINLRFGDYVNNPEVAKIFHVCKRDYYINAINYIKQNVENPTFFVFSDEINRVMEYLPEGEKYIICDSTSSWQEDFYFAKSAKHNIIPNSSFSWWSAWLNDNKNKIVVAPKHWYTKECGQPYKDILPSAWVKVDNLN